MPDQEGYYVATYNQKYSRPAVEQPEREVVKVFLSGSGFTVTRHGFARAYKSEYFIFHSRIGGLDV